MTSYPKKPPMYADYSKKASTREPLMKPVPTRSPMVCAESADPGEHQRGGNAVPSKVMIGAE